MEKKKKEEEEKQKALAVMTPEQREARNSAESERKAAEDEAALLSILDRKPVEYAVCLDTLSQNRRFSEQEVTFVRNACKALKNTLQRIDLDQFKHDMKKKDQLLSSSVRVKSDEEEKSEMAELRSKISEREKKPSNRFQSPQLSSHIG